ncbi:Adenylosuccinate lyase [Alteracholeplasma palmae J233]|uniref:Adenylosuccinate lyase n=1 Tax=Alteracholeplasma palmae (strain ATCC 49389 / J233) TaxID=1318466 RepID=U4KP13_ALTPJ|nr:adenylosuccinate lyase [Alteracholeplasma palmae]CCV63935.1 Adenylosuccinate lyase [Alteracholeplasma palmae J233]
MINRYKRDMMHLIWTDENKFKTFLLIELTASEAFQKLGKIPLEDLIKLKENATFDLERIYELENETKHDVIAFTRAVSESLGDEKKWVHYGLTSTDIVDTANSYLLKQANDIIEKDLYELKEVLKEKALEYKEIPCIGRTHGIHADITSFGLKWALWYDELNRNIERFKYARNEIEVAKLSGAVGNYANTDPFIQEYVAEKLGLKSAHISTQVLQRDRHAFYMQALNLIASLLEKIALEVRHLQRTEVNEVSEYFDKNQKGSSAMPHKKNPITSENITGCARVFRGYVTTFNENIALWHERDISHSSTERIILPDATMLLDYMLNRYTKTLKDLIVRKDKMLLNIYKTHGVIFSQRVLSALIEKGFSREKAYDMVQKVAIKAYEENIDFFDLLIENKILDVLTKKELEDCFTLGYYFKNIEYIYKKVGLI